MTKLLVYKIGQAYKLSACPPIKGVEDERRKHYKHK